MSKVLHESDVLTVVETEIRGRVTWCVDSSPHRLGPTIRLDYQQVAYLFAVLGQDMHPIIKRLHAKEVT